MKNLLYLALIALFVTFVTSCSVDSIQEETSFDFETELRSSGKPAACNSADLVDSNGSVIGTVEAFDSDENIRITLTTYDWKIRNSKLYVGPAPGSGNNPALFELGKYEYTETFEYGVYVVNYEFNKIHFKTDYCMMASLSLKDDYGTENGFSSGKPVPNSENGLYLIEFFKNCL